MDAALNELRETLNLKHSNELSGKLRQLANKVKFELDEMVVYLDRPEPNIQGALNRVRDMLELLSPHLKG